ncbi:MAG: phosphate ABC transporter permease subunit PstC [candidate division NC10 bacterium]|nr:phosphate ABC transporter permease subunit PstC [candidate division NC10 bacterium]
MRQRRIIEHLSGMFMRTAAIFAIALAFLITLGLWIRSWPILSQQPIGHLLFSSSWHPLQGEFGFAPFIVGTLEVTLIGMVISVPICLLTAIYLSEYAHRRLREVARQVIDIMAAIPSVVYGLWAVIVIVPLVRALGRGLGYSTTGYSLLSGGIILAIMAFPVIISVCIEVFRAVPNELRETALALGSTRWEMVKHVVLKSARRGILSAIVLGFARVFGETMAVLMVVGNVARIPRTLFDPAYPLPALIANNYGEMMSIPRYDAALLLAALILLLVVGGFNLMAHWMIIRMERA